MHPWVGFQQPARRGWHRVLRLEGPTQQQVGRWKRITQSRPGFAQLADTLVADQAANVPISTASLGIP